jgi:hypothetical protein
MKCAKCNKQIEKGQKYHRTKNGFHHAACTVYGKKKEVNSQDIHKEHILSKDCWCKPKVVSYKPVKVWMLEWVTGQPDIAIMKDNGKDWRCYPMFQTKQEAIAYRDEKHLAKSANVRRVSICL